MKKLDTFVARIILQNGNRWVGTFVGGRPTADNILSAMVNPGSDYATLVRGFLLPTDNTRECVYAGTNVGRIEVEEQLPSFVVEDAE
jgi:hypothetical protein